MRPESVQNIRVIDSHTGGEPTRVLYEGLSDLELLCGDVGLAVLGDVLHVLDGHGLNWCCEHLKF